MTDYRYLLLQIVDELVAHDAVVVEDSYLGDGLRQQAIDEAEEEFGLRLAESIKAFYRQVNGVIIEWQLDPETSHAVEYLHEYEDPIYGSVNIMTLREMLPSWVHLQDSVWDEMMDAAGRKRLSRFRPFDQNVEEAFVGLLIEDDGVSDTLYYLRQEEQDLIEMKSTIEQYLEALRQSRGFYWWQDAFALRPAHFGAREMFAYVPQLFPGEQFSAFD